MTPYLTNLAARYPECVTASGLANPYRLAERECAAMKGRQYDTRATTPAEVMARRAKWIDALPAGEFTAGDAARVWGVTVSSATSRLHNFAGVGLVARVGKTRPAIWARK